MIDNKSVKFTVQDTPGQEEFVRLRAVEYRDQDVVLICFSIIDPDSFENIEYLWKREVLRYCHDVSYILVRLKKDLRFNPESLNRLTRMGKQPISPQKVR